MLRRNVVLQSHQNMLLNEAASHRDELLEMAALLLACIKQIPHTSMLALMAIQKMAEVRNEVLLNTMDANFAIEDKFEDFIDGIANDVKTGVVTAKNDEREKAALAMQAKPHDATIVDSRARTEEKLDDTWFIETERASRKMCGTLFSQSIVARRAEVERMLDKAAGVDEVQPSVSLSV